MATQRHSNTRRETVRAAYPSISKSQAPRSQTPVRIAFVILLDATGSMATAIEAVIRALRRMVDVFMTSQVIPTLGLVVFRDETYGERPIVLPLGTSAEEICELLKTTEAYGGEDAPESSLLAVMRALDQLQRAEPGAKKIILLITDAPPHDPERSDIGNLVTAEVVREALTDQQVLFFACTPTIEPYKSFANLTGGTLFPLQKDMDEDTFKDLLVDVAHQTVKTVRHSGPVITDEALALMKNLDTRERQ